MDQGTLVEMQVKDGQWRLSRTLSSADIGPVCGAAMAAWADRPCPGLGWSSLGGMDQLHHVDRFFVWPTSSVDDTHFACSWETRPSVLSARRATGSVAKKRLRRRHVAKGQSPHAQLREANRSSRVQLLNDGRVVIEALMLKGVRAPRRRIALDGEEVLDSVGNAVQRTAIVP